MSLALSSQLHRLPRVLQWAAALTLGLVLTACGNRNKDAAAASQTAAKVNKEEITVHQINFVLAQQRSLPPAQAASAAKIVLERLIDQELEVQKATDQKLDRDPRVVQALEAARRDVIARAYLDKLGQGAPKPTPAEIKTYYDSHPALFAKRRVYTFQEVAVVAAPAQVDTLRAKLDQAKDLPEFISYLKTNNFKYAVNETTRAAEQLPLGNIDRFAGMKDSESLFTPTQNGVVILLSRVVSDRARRRAAGRAGHRAVPAQRAQAQADRGRSQGAAQQLEDRIRGCVRGRTRQADHARARRLGARVAPHNHRPASRPGRVRRAGDRGRPDARAGRPRCRVAARSTRACQGMK